MSFPYKYTRDIVFLKENLKKRTTNITDIKENLIKSIVKKRPLNYEIKTGKIVFEYRAPLFNFLYSTEIKIKENAKSYILHYDINLEKLIRIILIVIILTAFFSFLSVKYFLIISALLAVLLYGVAFLIIENNITNIINNSLEEFFRDNDEKEKLTEKQISWINDENKCSACGEILSDYDLHCPECGIKLKRKNLINPIDITKFQNSKLTYHIKKKK